MFMHLVIFIMVLQSLVFATDGDLDMSFGGDGIVTTEVGSSSDAKSVAIQNNGKIVAVGYSDNGSDNDFALVRYDTDGSLDSTFSGDGKVTTPVGDDTDYAYSVAIQSDGKIIVAGASYSYKNSDFALVRYNTNGSLDMTFDGNGKVITNLGGYDSIYSVAIQRDSKIIAAGHKDNGSNYNFALLRYDTNGSLDTTFDGDGKVITDLGGSNGARSVAIQSDGKIIVAGYRTDGSYSDFALLRYDANGSLDTTFNGNGIVIKDLGGSDHAMSVAIQNDGKIIVAGFTDDLSGNSDFALVRCNANGSPDTTFGDDGIVVTDVDNSRDIGWSVAIQSNGKIIIVGGIDYGNAPNFALVRYNTNGSLDTSFGDDGKAIGDVDNGEACSVAIQNDGKIVAVGESNNDFTVVRYLGTPKITLAPIYYLLQ